MKKWLTACVLFVAAGCAPPQGPHKPLHGEPGGGGANVSYAQAKPIFAKYCSSCHPSQHKPDWLDYQQAKEYAQNGLLQWRVWEQKSMPPPTSAQAGAITDAERSTLAQWAQAGAPETASENGGGAGGKSQTRSPQTPQAAQQCVQCHGLTQGEVATHATTPILVGQNAPYIVRQLQNFKWRVRRDPANTMNDVALALSDDEMKAAAEFFAGLEAFPPKAPPKSGVALGQKLAVQTCGHCHTDPYNAGRPADPRLPVLLGQQPLYLIHQLIAFRDGERPSPLMHEFTKELSNADLAALAEYFSFTDPKDVSSPTF